MSQTAKQMPSMPWEKPERTLEFKIINDDFDRLLRAVENKIDREWPARLGDGWHALPFLSMVKLARWTYAGTLYLLADSPPDSRRHLEYAVVAPPINRTIIDMVFNAVFIFDDYPERLCLYLTSGFDEMERKLNRFEQTYSKDPAWQDWLKDSKTATDPFAQSRDRVCQGRAPRTKGYFPHPGRMLRNDVKFNDPTLKDFLRFLTEWFYGDLSSSSHGHWSGLTERVVQIFRMESKDDLQQKFARKFKSDCIMQQMTLTLSLASEIIVSASLDNKQKAAYLWGILAAYWGEAKDLHSIRYAKLLQ